MQRLPLLAAATALALVAGWALLLLEEPGRSAIVAGLLDPALGLDHLLAILWLGLWAGRLGDRAPGLYPAAFLVGMVAGLVLWAGEPLGPVLAAVVHLLVLASIVLLVGAAVVPVRLEQREAVSTLALMGICHGVLHSQEVGAAPAFWFALGALASTAALAATGLALGRMMARTT